MKRTQSEDDPIEAQERAHGAYNARLAAEISTARQNRSSGPVLWGDILARHRAQIEEYVFSKRKHLANELPLYGNE